LWYDELISQCDTQNIKGLALLNGSSGQRKDTIKAAEYFKRAAEFGFGDAQARLAWCYLKG
jgi:TPR repeat protein